MRIIPPAYTSGLVTHLDQCILNATCALVGAEDIPDFQKALLTIPAKCGGWSLPALNLINECAFVGGSAATPCIHLWDIPTKYTHGFMAKRTREIEKATQKRSETLGIDICEETNLSPYEYARGGFEERKPQNNLTRMVKTKRTQRLREAMTEDWRRWLDAASTDESPGASG